MDKRSFINIVKQALTLYLKKDLTLQKLKNIIMKAKTKTENNNTLSEEEKIIREETELLCFIFEQVPYYKLNSFLNEFKSVLYDIAKEDLTRYKYDIWLTIDYLGDLDITLKSRIITEIYGHILLAATHFYQYDNLFLEQDSKQFYTNLYNPKELFSWSLAHNSDCQQINLPIEIKSEENLRDKISKNNCKISNEIKKKTIKAIGKCFDLNTLISFENYLEQICMQMINATKQSFERNMDYYKKLSEIYYIVSFREELFTIFYNIVNIYSKKMEKNKEKPILQILMNQKSTKNIN